MAAAADEVIAAAVDVSVHDRIGRLRWHGVVR